MLDFCKPFRMKNGTEVAILSKCMAGAFPLLGEFNTKCYSLWNSSGECYCGNPDHQLENIPVEREVWINIYSHRVAAHSSKERANEYAGDDRIGLVKVIVEEGRFDE